MPTKDVIKRVDALEPGTTVHVMCPPTKGADVAVQVASRIAARGFIAVPHLAARTVRGRSHLVHLAEQIRMAGITSIFVPGGDGEPAGPYEAGADLLDDLAQMDHGLSEIGVPCYPEGHVKIDDQTLFDALQYMQRIATFMVSQLTFNPEHILVWQREMRVKGITLPLMVGVPGVIPFPRLIRACTEWGLGQSLKYVTKQHGLIRAVVGGKFNPTEVVDYCEHVREDPYLNIANIHFITLNAVKSTRTWWEARVAE